MVFIGLRQVTAAGFQIASFPAPLSGPNLCVFVWGDPLPKKKYAWPS